MHERPGTLPALAAHMAARCGDRPALIEDGEALTFAGLDALSARLATGLAAHGIGAGDTVAVWLPNTKWWLASLFALARLGALCMCVNTRFRAAEVADIIERSRACALVYAPGFRGIDFDGILVDVPEATRARLALRVACGPCPAGAVPIDELVQAEPLPARAVSPDMGIVMFTTSGTTSRPKFVLHDQRSLTVHARDVAAGFSYDEPGSMLLQALPLCGTFGLAQALAALAAGSPSVLLPAFDARAAADLVAAHRITAFNGSDEMFARLLDAAQAGALTSLGPCGFACFAAPRPADFVRDCEVRGLQLHGLYGMSEVQALFARQPMHLGVEERALAGGMPTSPGARVRVCDPDTGAPLGPGASGELHVAGPSRFAEYIGNVEATAAAIGDDGYVRTGDLGHLCEDGRFVFETRMGDSLRLGGFLVNPAEIDAWLQTAPGVAAAQTVAVEIDGRLRPVSFVIAGDDGAAPDEAALIALCRDGLAGFKVPARILAIDAFPTTDSPNGRKIQRGRLRELARDLCRSPAP